MLGLDPEEDVESHLPNDGKPDIQTAEKKQIQNAEKDMFELEMGMVDNDRCSCPETWAGTDARETNAAAKRIC
jgi:hypothetical protein